MVFFNNPKNGAEVVKNTNYFFRYNNVLFISIDSEAAAKSSTAMEKQKLGFPRSSKPTMLSTSLSLCTAVFMAVFMVVTHRY